METIEQKTRLAFYKGFSSYRKLLHVLCFIRYYTDIKKIGKQANKQKDKNSRVVVSGGRGLEEF